MISHTRGTQARLDGTPAPASPWRETWRELRHLRGFLVGGTVFGTFLLMATFAGFLAPFDPAAIQVGPRLTGPSWPHLMGTDEFGRDVLTRVIFGSRLSMLVGFAAVAISVLAGTFIGLTAGYRRGILDTLLMRTMDVLLTFPGIMLALALAAVIGTGMFGVILAVGVSGVPLIARVVRGEVLKVAQQEYVLAARSTGCSTSRIIKSHILPNVAGSVIVMSTLQIAFAVLVASTLSFLGVGVQPPTPEWGGMTNAGRDVLVVAWWVSTFPGLMIVIFVLAINLIGDAVRDALDRTLRLT